MPRRRKTGGSPSRKNGNSDRTAVAVFQGDPSRSMSQAVHSVNKEELFNSMSEMFSDLDPSVVYMVLSECDFKGKQCTVGITVLFRMQTDLNEGNSRKVGVGAASVFVSLAFNE